MVATFISLDLEFTGAIHILRCCQHSQSIHQDWLLILWCRFWPRTHFLQTKRSILHPGPRQAWWVDWHFDELLLLVGSHWCPWSQSESVHLQMKTSWLLVPCDTKIFATSQPGGNIYLVVFIQGASFWDYSRMRMHGMRITDYLEYYQGKEWVIRKQFHSWEELAWELIRGSEKSKKSIAGSCILRKEHFLDLLCSSE